MSSIIEIEQGITEIRISINAPISEVLSAVSDLAKELNVYSEDPQMTLEAVAQATKNWWFDKVITQKSKQIEEYSKHLAEETKESLLGQLNSSSLRGA